MKISKLLAAAALSLFSFASCSDQIEDSERQSVFDDATMVSLYDSAYRGDTATLYQYAESETAAYRMAYARLMGSVLPEVAPEELENLLMDPIPYVRLYAAFAIGQIGNQKSLAALEKGFKKATIPEIKAEFLEAIGKCADANAMEFLVTHNPNTAIEESGKVWGVYRGMIHGQLQEEHLDIIVAHLKSNEDETRLAAANILSRQKEFDLSAFAEEIYQRASAEKSPEIKATLGYALTRTEFAEKFAEEVLSSDDSPLLRSVGLSALPNSQAHIQLLEDALISESPWVAMTAAGKIAEIDSFTPSASTIAAARTSEIPEVVAIVSKGLLSEDSEQGREFYDQAWNRMGNDVKRSVMLSIWAYFPQGLDTLNNYLFEDGPLGTSATMAYMAGLKNYPDWNENFVAYADRALSQGLLSQSYLFAEALRDPERKELISSELLLDALKKFSTPELVEGYQAIAATLKENYGIEKEPLSIEHPPIDWDMVKSLGQKPALSLYVSGEEYLISLVPEDAPSSVSQIANLAAAGFYDGTYFHRIVPGFVSQGGGPRGDGYGSDDHILRSEFSPLKYGTGVVGLASAGKDTESCQFFFTHLPTPHLDGRYTIIGASQSDISNIETGARIDSVRIKQDKVEM
ncbi:peptidylprolyl isomerase [Cryomorphaceae bacterium 1068]|nr:peptidylprolyl isomerase [Cryomorphaceae bacterium 1068]